MSEEALTENNRNDDIGVGAMLRASRMRHGQDLRTVAAMLCVRYPYLEAIENGRYEDLPGRTYAVGFIRAYAEYLGLDSDEVVRRFKEDVAAGKARTELHFPTPVLETSIPSGAIISVGIVIAVIAYGGWYMSTAEDGFIAGLIEPLPQRFSALISSKNETVEKKDEVAETMESAPVVETPPSSEPAPVAEPQPEPKPEPDTDPQPNVETAVAPVETAPAVEVPATVIEPVVEPVAEAVVEPVIEPVAEAVNEPMVEPIVEPVAPPVVVEPTPVVVEPVIEQPSPPAPVAEEAQPDPQRIIVETLPALEQAAVAPEAEAPPPPAPTLNYRQITVRANRDSWFEIKDEFGSESLEARTLRVGEEYRVPNRSGLLLVTGNAGALEILIDGESVPPIGADGAVLRGVRLDADMLLNGTAAAE